MLDMYQVIFIFSVEISQEGKKYKLLSGTHLVDSESCITLKKFISGVL